MRDHKHPYRFPFMNPDSFDDTRDLNWKDDGDSFDEINRCSFIRIDSK